MPAARVGSSTHGSFSRALLVLLALALSALATHAQDTVDLNDGTHIEGRVIFENDKKVIVRVNSHDRELERGDVKRVDSLAGSLRLVLGRWDGAANDAAATLDLARFCKSKGLTGEAAVFAYRVLAADGKNEEAHVLLGHDKRGDGWVVRDGDRRYSYFELGATRKDWRRAWEFETTHYKLVTNMELAAACDLALELELFYRAFYDWFGKELELHEVVKPMLCEVHADRDSYPNANGRLAYYDPERDTVYELAATGLVLDVLIHEATHQILHDSALELHKSSGDVPGWLDEGLAEYMSGDRAGDPGHGAYDQQGKIAEHFATHRGARKPYDLDRILNFSAGDFSGTSKTDLKYAQSYTLVHFCLLGDSGAHRADFLDFLRIVYDDKGSAATFESAMKAKGRAFEKAWTAYVQSSK